MADENATSANGQGATQPGQGQASSNQNGNGNGQSAEPKWLSYVPETEREDARKSYMLHSDYSKKTAEISERQKAWDTEKAQLAEANKKYQEWWSGFEPTFQQISEPNNWQKIQAILTGKQPAPAANSQQTGQDDLWRDYDLQTPQEQAKRQSQYIAAQHREELTKMRQEMQQQIQQEKLQAQNYMAIMTDAFNRKANDSTLDVPAFIQKQLEFSMGKFNPGELAYKTMTSERDMKKLQDEWLKKGREERDLELKNQQQSNGAGINPSIMSFKQPPMSRDQIAEAMRKQATEKGIAWHRDE